MIEEKHRSGCGVTGPNAVRGTVISPICCQKLGNLIYRQYSQQRFPQLGPLVIGTLCILRLDCSNRLWQKPFSNLLGWVNMELSQACKVDGLTLLLRGAMTAMQWFNSMGLGLDNPLHSPSEGRCEQAGGQSRGKPSCQLTEGLHYSRWVSRAGRTPRHRLKNRWASDEPKGTTRLLRKGQEIGDRRRVEVLGVNDLISYEAHSD